MVVASFVKNDKQFNIDNFYDDYVIANSEDENCIDPNQKDMISVPHSNSFLDLDGDCMPDIFLTKQVAKSKRSHWLRMYRKCRGAWLILLWDIHSENLWL